MDRLSSVRRRMPASLHVRAAHQRTGFDGGVITAEVDAIQQRGYADRGIVPGAFPGEHATARMRTERSIAQHFVTMLNASIGVRVL